MDGVVAVTVVRVPFLHVCMLRDWDGGVISVCVVSLDPTCRWQVQVSVYCARWIPAHLRCT